MEDKKQDVNSLKELVKTADSFREFFANLVDELSKVLVDIKALKKEEDTWEMECPYEGGDEYYLLDDSGSDYKFTWDGLSVDKRRFEQGNVFPTKEEAELELKRRNLLTRFRAFRDECNGDWKADWMDYLENKFLVCIVGSELEVNSVYAANDFVLFGYFKNPKDVERAIELFGDEIKELFVEGE